MKLLICAVATLSFAQSADPPFAKIPVSSLAGNPVPRWNGALFLPQLERSTGNEGLWAFDSLGRQVILDLKIPGGPLVNISDACGVGDGFAVAASLLESSGRLAFGVLFFDADGGLRSIVRTNPYKPKHIVAGVKNDVWTFGENEMQGGRPPIANHPMLYHFDSNGGVLGKFGNSMDLGFGGLPDSFVRHRAAASMLLAGDRIVVYLHKLTKRYFEFDLSGGLIAKRTVPPPTEAVDGRTESMEIQYFGYIGPEKRPLALFDGLRSHGYYALDPVSFTWIPTTGVPSGLGRIVGVEGNRFVVGRKASGAEWQYSFASMQ